MFKDFWERCVSKGPTITLIKTSKNRICGGFTMVSWNNPAIFYDYKRDDQAFIFSVDQITIYRPNDSGYAVYHRNICGPCFGGSSLRLTDEPMNK